MRKLLLLLLAALAAACGSDSSSGGGAKPSGTVGGRAFTPVDVSAVVAGTGTSPCQLPLGGATIPIGLKAAEITVTSYADSCGDFASSQCRLHANAQSVMLLVAKLDPTGKEPELKAGTYTVATSPTSVTPDDTGLLTVAYAQALATDAACAGTPSPTVQGGTIRIDKATGPITGHVSLTFQDGSKLEGDFSAPICSGAAPDVCAIATSETLCTLPPVCVQ